jgi:hypothetical protein
LIICLYTVALDNEEIYDQDLTYYLLEISRDEILNHLNLTTY